MAKFNEIAYIILDELKQKSDDSSFNIDHIVFIMLQYRSLLLKQRYTDQKKDIPTENYQTICVDLEYSQDCNTGEEVASVQKIPNFTNLNGGESITINPIGDMFNNIEYVYTNSHRFPYVGNNKWLKNIIYFTKGSDGLLRLKSRSPNFKYLKRVQISGLFDDVLEAGKLSCDSDGNYCNYMESDFPLETSLVPVLIDMCVRELTPPTYKPEDDINNASDDLSGIG